MRLITDETISMKEVSGNTSYLNEVIHGLIEEDQNEHLQTKKETPHQEIAKIQKNI